MKRILIALGFAAALAVPAHAQVGSAKSPTALNTETNTNFADNTTGAITPAVMRQMLLDIVASYLNVPNLGGDCLASSNVLVVCTKTNGVAFAASATTDTTNATNITTGTLSAAQLVAGVPANVLRTVTINDSVLNTDCGKTINITGSNLVETLPAVAGFPTTCTVTIKNANTTRGQQLSGFPSDIKTKLYPLQTIQVSIINGAWASTMKPRRWEITSATTFFVDTAAGNDANDCLAAGAGACSTSGQAMSDISLNVEVNATTKIKWGCASPPCTYTNLPFTSKAYVGTAGILLEGDVATPANVVMTCNVTCGSSIIINISNGGLWGIHGFTLSSSGGSNFGLGLNPSGGGAISATFGNLNFGAFVGGTSQIITSFQVQAANDANYTISGGAGQHLDAEDNSTVHLATGTITLTGTPAFSASFLGAHGAGAIIGTIASVFSGAATGVRCTASLLGLVDTGGTSASLPGNSACTTGGGGVVN